MPKSISCDGGDVCETLRHLNCANTCMGTAGSLLKRQPRINSGGFVDNFDPDTPLHNASVVFTNARDESHVAEWVQHHLNLGFDRVVVIDHLSARPVLDELAGWSPKVDVCRYSKEVESLMKDKLMNAALWLAAHNGYAWMLYEDVDEYLVLNKHDSVGSFLEKWSFADQVYINWLMFGSNFLKRDPEGPILGRYLRSNGRLAYRHKAMVRPRAAIRAAGPHTYELKAGPSATSLSLDGERAYGLSTKLVKMGYNEVDAYIAHYIVQAEEVYLDRKMRRPRDDTGLMRPHRNISLMQLHNGKICTEVMVKYEEILVRSLLNTRKAVESGLSCKSRLLADSQALITMQADEFLDARGSVSMSISQPAFVSLFEAPSVLVATISLFFVALVLGLFSLKKLSK